MHKSTLVVEASKFLEARLTELGATGHGLGQQAASIRNILPSSLRRELKVVVDMRNQEVHGSSEWDEVTFLQKALSVATMLGEVASAHCKQTHPESKAPDAHALTSVDRSQPNVQPARQKLRGPILQDADVVKVIDTSKPSHSQDELDDLIDAANALAHKAHIVTSEPWDAFLYILKTLNNDDDARLRQLQLAVLAGLELDRAVEIATEFLSDEFLSGRLQTLLDADPIAP